MLQLIFLVLKLILVFWMRSHKKFNVVEIEFTLIVLAFKKWKRETNKKFKQNSFDTNSNLTTFYFW